MLGRMSTLRPTLRVAAAAYPVRFLASWDEYAAGLTRWVEDAARQGAELLVFPEYAPLELVSLLPAELHHDITGMRPALQALLPGFLALHERLAREHGVTIVAGSFPVAHGGGENGGGYVNRAHVFGPQGPLGHQDKLLMTRFEAEEWFIDPGAGVRVFEAGGICFGVVICYDSEFPHLSRAQAELGAELLVVPSFTASRAGFTRVKVGSMARALENQCYALHAPLLADAPWSYAIEDAAGQAGIYAPSDDGLPEDGVVMQADWNAPGWLVCDLDFTLTRRVRQAGHVLNWRDREAGLSRVQAQGQAQSQVQNRAQEQP